MSKLQILKEIRESNYSASDLNVLLIEIKAIKAKKQAEESIESKRREIVNLEQKISEIDAGNYKEDTPQEEERNYY